MKFLAHCCSALLALTSLSSFAQEPAPETTLPATALHARRNLLRVDMAGLLVTNLEYNLISNRKTLMPVLLGYERGVSRHWSVGTEVLLNGGNPEERLWGASLQGRVYARPATEKQLPTGFYLAPTLGYRHAKVSQYGFFGTEHHLGGVGAHTGVLLSLSKLASGLVIDTSLGVMGWQTLGEVKLTGEPEKFGYSRNTIMVSPQREGKALVDGRFSVGWRF
ncbi:hypothetical protein LJY25_05840 [Hymenobacter sp. BT175]|uniref:hypothetical protein n=1 Tax=Hymenobacter translucens TaxID=2886507 RepID=UPI001D0F2043|nr:hypothetical protein [Hymenobacter translucens]MCC2545958.1 hypothetical protein [Hymenobacter translucens]